MKVPSWQYVFVLNILYSKCTCFLDEATKKSDGIIWPEHQERLQRFHNELLKNLDIKPLLPEFYSRGTSGFMDLKLRK